MQRLRSYDRIIMSHGGVINYCTWRLLPRQFTLPDIGVLSPLWVLKSILRPVLASPWKFEHSAPPETRLDRVQVHLASQPAICRCGALDAPGSFLSLLNFIYVEYKNKWEREYVACAICEAPCGRGSTMSPTGRNILLLVSRGEKRVGKDAVRQETSTCLPRGAASRIPESLCFTKGIIRFLVSRGG